MLILGIDPGTTHSAGVLIDAGSGGIEVSTCFDLPNEKAIWNMQWGDALAIEMIQSFGKGSMIGADTIWTIYWIGRFAEFRAASNLATKFNHSLYLRSTIRANICGTAKAKDGVVRQAIIDRLGPPGTKKNPGPTYGVTGHCWQALAVAICHADGIGSISPPRKEG